MQINLAGYNVDADILSFVKGKRDLNDPVGKLDVEAYTPETISAAYARISRDPAPVDELRARAREEVAKARKTNTAVVFDMGHQSVAEHAVLNFDILGVSRLAIEAIEHSRLASYTEKSQRYCRLDNDYVVPQEVKYLGLEQELRDLVAKQNRAYNQLHTSLLSFHTGKGMEAKAAEGKAKEDARYVTCLAVEGQLGMTVNARSLEMMIRRLISHPLNEVQEIGKRLHDIGKTVVPSLLKYCEPVASRKRVAEVVAKYADSMRSEGPQQDVYLVEFNPSKYGDEYLLSTLLHSGGQHNWESCIEYVMAMSMADRVQMMRFLMEDLQSWDALPRAFESVSFAFEAVVSASCFAQLKRHRMATLLPQPYNTGLGFSIPPSIEEANLIEICDEVAEVTSDLYHKIAKSNPPAAEYVLLQAHQRRVLVTMNGRELYAFSRLREDGHAQWEIRALANKMLDIAREKMPLTFSLACGKDKFDLVKAAVYHAG